jgi:class 3 adenylate cyclase/tetratricopeptide (TPR) repeat protein
MSGEETNRPEDTSRPVHPSQGTQVSPEVSPNGVTETIEFSSRPCPPGPGAGPDAPPPAAFGRYQVLDFRGRGGFGEVYLGHDPQLDRPVAIKVLRPRAAGAADKLLREARQLAQLSHPGIVTVYDAGVQDGRPYVVSDYLQGVSLHEWLAHRRPTWQEAARLIAAVADALAYAHARRTIHRDVKPDNIILKDGTAPVLVDFGLAISDATPPESEFGHISGTPLYMAPEQAAGKGHRIDGRTDIYALGVILYRMLCGRLPFQASVPRELLRQVQEDDPQPPRQLNPAVPAGLERICLKAMAKRPDDRYTTAGDLAADLLALLKAPDAPGPPPAPPAANRPPAGRRARQAERRQVTVLYCQCDLFDAPEFLDRLGPEEQHEVLRDYLAAAGGAAARFGGTVVQATGRELLVCLGYPVSYEDTARRAVLTGLAIRDAVAELAERLQPIPGTGLAVRVGIHTGPVVAEHTAAGAGESLALAGEARNVATRLVEAAGPNTVIISQATHRITRGFFVCEGLGERAVPGAARPVELFRVLHASDVRSPLEVAESAGLTPLVGRDLELGILQDRWEKAGEGMGQVVLLVGEPGLGKSRLVRELRASAGNTSQGSGVKGPQSSSGSWLLTPDPWGGMVAEWRCSPYYQNTGFYPAVNYFERLLGFGPDDPPGQRLDRLVQHLESCGLANPQTVPLFAALLSVPLDGRYEPPAVGPQRQKELLLEALLDWLWACAAARPLLLIVEDLHWIDPSTLELLGLLVGQAERECILTVLTARPEFEAPWRGRANLTELAVNRLTRRQVGEMMEKKAGRGGLPAGLVERVVERSDGVPLFIEEFTQVLLESGALPAAGGPAGPADEDLCRAIPASLQDLLAARLNRLEIAPEVVQMAAALGREFGFELIRAVLGLNEPALLEELAKLVKAAILFQRGRPPRCTYTFKHALLQDAAYQTLLRKRRQQCHQTIAEVLERQFPERAGAEPELLAHHFTEAGLDEKAVAYWRKAGLRSQDRSANREAIGHLSRGLEVLKRLPPSPERDRLELGLQAPLGVVLTAVRGWGAQEVAPAIERARELAWKVGTDTDRFFVLWGLWGFRLLRLELDKCWEIAAEVMRLAEGSPEGRELLAEAHWLPGCTAFYQGDFTTALEHFRQGLELYDPARVRTAALRTGQNVGVLYHSHIAVALWELGSPDQALARAEETVRFARELGHPFSLAMALHYRRRVYQCCRLEDRVASSIEEEHEHCHRHGFGFWGGHAVLARGGLLARRGEVDAARALIEPAVRALDASGCKCSLSHPYAFLAECFLQAGRVGDALAWLGRGFDLAENHNERCLESELLRLKGEALLASAGGDPAEAEACLLRAAEVARRQRARSRQLRAAVSLARLWRRQGRSGEARQALDEALAGLTEGLGTADLVEARALLEELRA